LESITEEMKVHEQWYIDAGKVTLETLPEFLRHLTEDYKHDYGTICRAIAAGAVATAWAIDHSSVGGITGFQAGAVMWEFITHWMSEYKDKPLKLVNYENMLFPQYEDKFDTTISPDTWQYLQKEARRMLDNKPEKEGVYEVDHSQAHPAVRKHWQSIVDGKVPFGYRVRE
jgi:hypothetical protein